MGTVRIGLEYSAALHQTAGIGRYERQLAAALVAAHPEVHWRLFAALGALPETGAVPARAALIRAPLSERNLNRLWQRLRTPLPVETWTGPLDLYHGMDFLLPPLRRGTPSVVSIHDLSFELFPAETMPGMRDFLGKAVPRSVRRADHVIADSEATRRDLIDLYKVDPARVTTVPLGVDERFTPDGTAGEGERMRARYGLGDSPFLLTVSTLQPRKNHLRLVQAFAEADLPGLCLVIAGGQGWAYEQVHAEVNRLRLGGRVIFPGFVADADLPALYRTAAGLVYPSLYEGFGLPPLEAMACGTPVLASNAASLPEVVGDAALVVDPLDVHAIAAGLGRLAGDEAVRAALREKGTARARLFTWARAAEATWAVYCGLITCAG